MVARFRLCLTLFFLRAIDRSFNNPPSGGKMAAVAGAISGVVRGLKVTAQNAALFYTGARP